MSEAPGPGEGQSHRRVMAIGVGAVVVVGVAVAAIATLGSGTGAADGPVVEGATIEAEIEDAAVGRGFDGLSARCPESMAPRDGDEDTCTFTERDGSSGVIQVTWNGDAGRFFWLVQVG